MNIAALCLCIPIPNPSVASVRVNFIVLNSSVGRGKQAVNCPNSSTKSSGNSLTGLNTMRPHSAPRGTANTSDNCRGGGEFECPLLQGDGRDPLLGAASAAGGGSADRSSAERRSPPRTVRVGPPFLERCAAQLPCLRDGLDPRDGLRYPNLARWYTGRWTRRSRRNACRVSGNPSSWRMVLTMAGYGNAGNVPPSILGRMRDLGWRGGVDRGRRRR